MTTSVLVIQNNGTVKDVIQLIRSTSHDGFPVVNPNNNVVGYIAARNIVGYAANDKIEPLMDPNTFHIHPNNSMQDVARKMFRSCIQKVPIIDNQNKLVGIITNSDVIRSQIERVTPEKVFEYIQTLKKLYKIQPQLSRGMVLVNSLIPTQSKVYIDELDERSYEIINGLVEPLLVVHWNKKYILVDGHHRAVAALKMGIKELESYIIEVDSDIVLGIEKTSRNMHLLSLNDVKILDESHCDFLK
ncbi:MAG TPA: CBS domain-containing protein [Methanocorpusculum sp.]|nr:CBS domain-containing protein [Methanocorpusculum sp.]